MRHVGRTLLVACALALAVPTSSGLSAAPETMSDDETVVLLHGLGRSSWSMWIMQRRLESAGFHVENVDYPSRRYSIDALADYLRERLAERGVIDGRRLHFVTHSMGGIVARAYIAEYGRRDLGRVVMLAPPNGGSEIVDLLGENRLFRAIVGPAAVDLGTVESSAPRRLGPAQFELGVIMGSRSLNPVGSWILSGPDDGTVTVESAKLEGMRDFALVPASHTFIMTDRNVAERAINFLRYGRFDVETNGETGLRGAASRSPDEEPER